MKFEICYTLPRGDEHLNYAFRFLSTYLAYPPNIQHDTIILTDEGYEEEAKDLFRMLPGVRAVATPDHGKDLSRYQAWCQRSNADCVLFLGGSTYCRRAGWGLRMIGAFMNHGQQHLYGAMPNTGNGPVSPHLRSTGFWCSPALFNRYPIKATSHIVRYEIEHGRTCFTGWVLAQGLNAFEVTFGGVFPHGQWHSDQQGYAHGSQQNLVIGDRLTGPPYFAHP